MIEHHSNIVLLNMNIYKPLKQYTTSLFNFIDFKHDVYRDNKIIVRIFTNSSEKAVSVLSLISDIRNI